MKINEISRILEKAGLTLQPKAGIAIDAGVPTKRYSRSGVRGSIYIAENYLSATGKFAEFREIVPQTRTDRQGYPVWRDGALSLVLDKISESEP